MLLSRTGWPNCPLVLLARPRALTAHKCAQVRVYTCQRVPGRARWPRDGRGWRLAASRRMAAPGLRSGGSGPWPTSPVGGQGLLRTAEDGDKGHPQPWALPLCSPFEVALGSGLSTLGFCPMGGVTHTQRTPGRGDAGTVHAPPCPPIGPAFHSTCWAPGVKRLPPAPQGPREALSTAVPGCWEDGHPAQASSHRLWPELAP